MDQTAPMIQLAWPWVLLLLPLPWLVYRWLPPAPRQQAALRTPFLAQLTTTQHGDGVGRTSLRRAWWPSLIWLLLVLACARPQWVGTPLALPVSGRDLMLAVDISGSMATPDMQLAEAPVSRLAAVKAVVGDFVARRQGDRLGLILFGSRAYLHTPLTFDRPTLQAQLQDIQVGMAGEHTAIGDAIGLAVKRLRQQQPGGRVLLLLSDGANTAGQLEPQQAAELARQTGLKIYTIGIGATELEVQTLLGFNQRINPSRDLDETTLSHIAQLTGGQYFRARNLDELAAIYQAIDRLEPLPHDAEPVRPLRSLAHWPLGLALALSLLLGLQRLDLLPKRKPTS